MVFPWTPGPGKSFRGTSSPSFSGKDTDEIATRRAGRDNGISRKRRAAASSSSTNVWTPLGPAPLASDASGNGTQDYHQVSGRATAVAIDPSDGTGNTVYIGGAQSGIWKSSDAASSNASDVIWTPVTDDQATLSTGAIAVQPGKHRRNSRGYRRSEQRGRFVFWAGHAALCGFWRRPGVLFRRRTAVGYRSAAWVERAWRSARPAGKRIRWSRRWQRHRKDLLTARSPPTLRAVFTLHSTLARPGRITR